MAFTTLKGLRTMAHVAHVALMTLTGEEPGPTAYVPSARDPGLDSAGGRPVKGSTGSVP